MSNKIIYILFDIYPMNVYHMTIYPIILFDIYMKICLNKLCAFWPHTGHTSFTFI